MTTFPRRLCHLQQLAGMLLALLVDALRYLGLCLRPVIRKNSMLAACATSLCEGTAYQISLVLQRQLGARPLRSPLMSWRSLLP
jgi:hypothetical protein